MKKHSILFISILLTGCLLRFILLNAPFTEDERKGVIIARSISLNPDCFNLPVEDPYETHPLLSVYATKIGMVLWGDSNVGIRFFHWLFGSLTLAVLYLLAKEMGRIEALWAVFLLAFDQFHMHVSVKAENNSLLFFLTTLTIYVFFKAIQNNNRKLLPWVGVLCGLAFLTKEVSVLLMAAFVLYLCSDARKRAWFRCKETYGAALLFLITVSPWIFWIMVHGSSQLMFRPEMYQKPLWIPNRTALNFFLIGPLSWAEGVDYRLKVSWEDAIVDGLSGVMLLAGVMYSLRFIKQDYFRLLYLIFIVFFGVLSFFSLPGLPWGEFWWAAVCLIPAVCLTARMFAELANRYWIFKRIVTIYGVYLVLNAVLFTMAVDRLGYPPRRFAAFVDDDYITARIYEDRKMFDQAIAEVKRLLENSPNDIETLSYLGWLHVQKNDFDAMLDAWFKAMEIEPDFIHPYNLFPTMKNEMRRRYALEADQGNQTSAHYYLGVLDYYNQAYDSARNELSVAVQLDAYRLSACYYLGMIGLKQNNTAEAIRYFNEAISLDPNYSRAYFEIGQSYAQAGQDRQAVEYYLKGLSINPDDARAYHYLGVAYQKLGLTDQAKRMERAAKSIYHDDLKNRFDLGQSYE